MTLGFIGFGDAAQAIAAGLSEAGLCPMYGWSRTFRYDARAVGVTPMGSAAELLESCDTVMVLVPGAAAVPMAQLCAPFLTAHHLYIDLTTSAPGDMRAVASILAPTGAVFADGAMLETVPKFGHRVPTALCGPGAQAAYDALTPYGMRFSLVGEQPGAADAIKLLRSVYTKNHLALAFEMLEAAAYYGVEDAVMRSLAETMDSKDFITGMTGRTCGGVIHASRRAHELTAAAEMLEADGLSACVTRAGAQTLRDIGNLNIRERLGGKKPADWKEAVQSIRDAREAIRKEP